MSRPGSPNNSQGGSQTDQADALAGYQGYAGDVASFPEPAGLLASSFSADNNSVLRQPSGGLVGTNLGPHENQRGRSGSVSSTGSGPLSQYLLGSTHPNYSGGGDMSMSPHQPQSSNTHKKPPCPSIDCSSQKVWKKVKKIKEPCLRGVGIGAAASVIGTLVLLLITLIWVGADVVGFQNFLNNATPAADKNDPGTQLAKVAGVAALITFLLTAVGVCVVPKDKCVRKKDEETGASDTPAMIV